MAKTGRLPRTADEATGGQPVDPEPGFRAVSPVERWRGTPELFAHVARVVQSVASDDQSDHATLSIDVEVDGDHEVFSAACEFLTNVSPEALRRFSSICIAARTESRSASITLRWVRTWWTPAMSPDGEVIVELVGDSAWCNRSRPILETTLARGTGRLGSEFATGVTAVGAATSVAIVLLSLTALLGIHGSAVTAIGATLIFVGFLGGMYAGAWAVPSLEIAAPNQTRIRRIVRSVGALVLAIGLAGVTKSLFG